MRPATRAPEKKENVYKNILNPMAQQKLSWDIIPLLELPAPTPERRQAQQALRERLTMPGDTVIKRFRSPDQINLMIAGEGMIYFVAGGDFHLKGMVEIDPWR